MALLRAVEVQIVLVLIVEIDASGKRLNGKSWKCIVNLKIVICVSVCGIEIERSDPQIVTSGISKIINLCDIKGLIDGTTVLCEF